LEQPLTSVIERVLGEQDDIEDDSSQPAPAPQQGLLVRKPAAYSGATVSEKKERPGTVFVRKSQGPFRKLAFPQSIYVVGSRIKIRLKEKPGKSFFLWSRNA
jgi:hypothetical protein